MVVINCAYPGCAFQSEDAPEAAACAILQSHAFSHAAPGPNFNRAPSEGLKLTRPSIDVGVSLEAWNVFTRRWQMFRQGSGINEASATAQLFQCASQILGDSLLKSDAEIVSKPLQELLSAMRRLAVIPVTTGVLRSDLMQMRQVRDEPFRAFAARVRGKADTCAFTVDCICGLKINYTDHMICDTLLNGIADDEIRREILGSTDVPTCAVASRNPPLPSHLPTTPFEKIDYAGRHFLIVGDKLFDCSDVFGTPAGITVTGVNTLVRLLRSYFATFRVPKEISSDGGAEFTAFVTQDFMRKWDIKHHVSSAYFPQSNGRAEVAVKAAKRLLMSNISPNGDLNNDSFLRALLQLRNTLDPDCNFSPAEIVFGHPLRALFRLLIGSPLFLIALFVVLGAKHGELKKMPSSSSQADQ